MSYGQRLLGRYLEALVPHRYLEDHRPDWMNGLELDFWFPDIGFAVEFNGDQHYFPTGFGDHRPQSFRDRAKKEICTHLRIPFLIVDASMLEYTILQGKIKRKIGRRNMTPASSGNYQALKQINADAIQYRKTLIKNYGAATAHRRGSKRRLNAGANLFAKYSR